MTDPHFCQEPGCGLHMRLADYVLLTYPPQDVWVCPRNAEEHRLCKRVAELESQSAKTCAWNLDDFDGSWDASCGLKWLLDETSNLADHEMNFCPKCGCKIEEVPYVQPNL